MEIKNQEDGKELISKIQGDLDWESVKQIVRDTYKLELKDEMRYKQGVIAIHNDEIAYRLDFEAKVNLSIMFNKNGDCLLLTAAEDLNPNNQLFNNNQPDNEHDNASDADQSQVRNDYSKKASKIADMISEINKE